MASRGAIFLELEGTGDAPEKIVGKGPEHCRYSVVEEDYRSIKGKLSLRYGKDRLAAEETTSLFLCSISAAL